MNSPPSAFPRNDGARALREEAGAATGNSSVRQRASELRDCNTQEHEILMPPFPETFHRRRTGRGALLAERAPSGTSESTSVARDGSTNLHSPAPEELNSARRLYGPISLPLSGFTYS